MLDVIADELIAVSSSVVNLDDTKHSPTDGTGKAEKATVSVHTASIRYTISGTDPTSASGHLAPAGTIIDLENETEINQFKAIRATSTDAEIFVSYE